MKKLLLILCIFSSTAFAETLIKDLNVTNTADIEAGATLTIKTGAKFIPQAPVVISASDIDWRPGNVYTKTLSANTTLTFSNVPDGKTIVVEITNTAGNFTLTWPTVRWPGDVTPIQTVGAKTDVYTLIKIGSVIRGSVIQNFTP